MICSFCSKNTAITETCFSAHRSRAKAGQHSCLEEGVEILYIYIDLEVTIVLARQAESEWESTERRQDLSGGVLAVGVCRRKIARKGERC